MMSQILFAKLRTRLQEQGASDPAVRIEVLEKLRQSASGKLPLVKALKTSGPSPNNSTERAIAKI